MVRCCSQPRCTAQRCGLLIEQSHTRPSSCSRSSAVKERGGRIGRACSSSVRGETKAGRASLGLGRASVSPDMVAAMLARSAPEPELHGGMCAARRRSVDSPDGAVGRVSALTLTYTVIVGNSGAPKTTTSSGPGPAHGLPFYAGHAAAARQNWITIHKHEVSTRTSTTVEGVKGFSLRRSSSRKLG